MEHYTNNISDIESRDNAKYWSKTYMYFSSAIYDNILEEQITRGYILNNRKFYHNSTYLTWIMNKLISLIVLKLFKEILFDQTFHRNNEIIIPDFL
jgi:hypothetical protein